MPTVRVFAFPTRLLNGEWFAERGLGIGYFVVPLVACACVLFTVQVSTTHWVAVQNTVLLVARRTVRVRTVVIK